MSTLALPVLLVRAQVSLPEPPQPAGSPEIDTVRVIGVVLVSLGIIVLLALALRPLVVRSSAVPPQPDPADPPDAETEPDLFASPGSGSIIRFPSSPAFEAPPSPLDADEMASVVADRFSRVVGEGNRRRKLGDRQPDRVPYDLAAAALHRVAPNVPDRKRRIGAEHGGAIVPLRGTANGTDGQALLDHPIGTPAVRGSRSGRPSQAGDAAEQPLEQPRPAVAGNVHGQMGHKPSDPAGGFEAANGDAAPAGQAHEPAALKHSDAGDLRAAAMHVNGHAPAESPFLRDLPIGVTASRGERSDDRSEAASDHLRSDSGSDTGADADRLGPVEPEATVGPSEIDTLTLASLHQVVRELIYCANSGQLLHGFALYSDPYLFRFMDGSGMTEDEFRETYGSVGPRPRNEWDHLDRLYDVIRLSDGRIEATASYVDGAGKPSNGIERYRFVLVDGAWQIDDIAPVEATA